MCPKFTWQELQRSAKSCYCCDILISGCGPCFHQHGIQESDIQYGSLHFYYPEAEDKDGGAEKELIFLLNHGKFFQIEFFVALDEEYLIPDSWDTMPALRRVSPRTDSAAAFATVQDWITECVNEDSFCASTRISEMPTRVIDVGLSGGNIRLIESKGAKDKYVCLSHCWGMAQIITTTKANMEDHKVNIAWGKLSKTFRDAITFTRGLGFRYIWIDSLCIIQDDAGDWNVESSKMASVYSNGYLTIAGTFAKDGHEGLFSPTEDIQVTGKSPSGEDYCLYFRERIDHHLEMCEDDSNETMQLMNPSTLYYPLLTRAWVYQERMLSTRVIHFGHYEVFLECKSGIRCECEGIGYHDYSSATQVVQMKLEHSLALKTFDTDETETKTEDDAETQYRRAQLWRTMVATYTSLRLTKSTDRLPAIGGLAKDFATRRKSRYLAGLWEDTLNDDLLWSVTIITDKKTRQIPPAAPSWSWASAGTTIRYWDEIFVTDADTEDYPPRRPFKHFATIDGCQVTPAAVDEFGSIAHGQITITGLVAHGMLEYELTAHKGIEYITASFVADKTRLPIRLDHAVEYKGSEHELQPAEVVCLRMSHVVEGLTDHLISLVLTRASTVDTMFERIGVLIIKAKPPPVNPVEGPFGAAKNMTLTLI